MDRAGRSYIVRVRSWRKKWSGAWCAVIYRFPDSLRKEAVKGREKWKGVDQQAENPCPYGTHDLEVLPEPVQ